MVTNINLVAPGAEKKSVLSGKTTLMLSAGLLILVLGTYGILSYLGNSYAQQKNQVESEIAAGKAKISGSAYANLSDFQERLGLLGKMADDHAFMDLFLKDFSRYIVPEVTLSGLTLSDSGSALAIKGTATNFESLAKEMILLKSFPGANSVQFKSGSEKAQANSGKSGVDFELNLKLNNTALKNK